MFNKLSPVTRGVIIGSLITNAFWGIAILLIAMNQQTSAEQLVGRMIP